MSLQTEKTQYNFDGEVQDDILRLILTDSMFTSAAGKLVKPGYFQGGPRQLVSKIAMGFHGKYSMPPSKGQLLTEIARQAHLVEATESTLEKACELTKRMFEDASKGSRDYTIDVVQTFAKHRAIEHASYASLPLLDEGKHDEILKLWKDVDNLTIPVDHDVYWYFETAKERIRRRGTEDEIEVFPTGIIEIDTLIRRGGIGRGEIMLWLGSKGSGKSVALCQMARRAVWGKHKVIYFSFEMSDDQLADREDAGFSDISTWNLEEQKEALLKTFGQLEAQFPRSFAIKRFPTKGASIADCDAVLESLRTREGWVPDMIILDYLSIVKPSVRRSEKHLEIQEIAEEFRGLCVKWDAAGHTANQINRTGASKVIADGTDAAGSWDQLGIVDYALTINRTRDQILRNRMVLYPDKIRDGIDKVATEELETDFEKMIFVRRTNKTFHEVVEGRKRRMEEMAAQKEEDDSVDFSAKKKGFKKRF